MYHVSEVEKVAEYLTNSDAPRLYLYPKQRTVEKVAEYLTNSDISPWFGIVF